MMRSVVRTPRVRPCQVMSADDDDCGRSRGVRRSRLRVRLASSIAGRYHAYLGVFFLYDGLIVFTLGPELPPTSILTLVFAVSLALGELVRRWQRDRVAEGLLFVEVLRRQNDRVHRVQPRGRQTLLFVRPVSSRAHAGASTSGRHRQVHGQLR